MIIASLSPCILPATKSVTLRLAAPSSNILTSYPPLTRRRSLGVGDEPVGLRPLTLDAFLPVPLAPLYTSWAGGDALERYVAAVAAVRGVECAPGRYVRVAAVGGLALVIDDVDDLTATVDFVQ